MQKFIFAAAILVSIAESQILRQGKCPLMITAQQNFSVEKFSGLWYEQVYTRRFSGLNIRCNVEHFTQAGPKNFSLNSFFHSEKENITYHIRGIGEVKQSANNSGILRVTIPKMNVTSDVWILETDYKNFAVLWNCVDMQGANYMENVEIITREKYAKNKVLLNALNVLPKKKIAKTNLSYAAQTNCPSYEKQLAKFNLTGDALADD
ncbi:apolipoprotein D-like isoform X2 [Cloeon dipterum]|uniref:apolipoprotein D-like isoform X2 n=1 Tax=Cloeon dipterum TaxID=197152 RepID=UPI00321FE501